MSCDSRIKFFLVKKSPKVQASWLYIICFLFLTCIVKNTHAHSSETKAFPSYCVYFASILISKVTLLNTAWNKKRKIQHKSTLYISMLVQSCAMKAFNRPSFFYFFALNHRIIRSLCFCNANRSVCPFLYSLLVVQTSE